MIAVHASRGWRGYLPTANSASAEEHSIMISRTRRIEAAPATRDMQLQLVAHE